MIMQMVSVMQVIIIDKYASHKTIVIASCTYRLYKWETKVLALAALVLQGWLFSAGCTSCPNQGTFFATIIMAHLLVCSCHGRLAGGVHIDQLLAFHAPLSNPINAGFPLFFSLAKTQHKVDAKWFLLHNMAWSKLRICNKFNPTALVHSNPR